MRQKARATPREARSSTISGGGERRGGRCGGGRGLQHLPRAHRVEGTADAAVLALVLRYVHRGGGEEHGCRGRSPGEPPRRDDSVSDVPGAGKGAHLSTHHASCARARSPVLVLRKCRHIRNPSLARGWPFGLISDVPAPIYPPRPQLGASPTVCSVQRGTGFTPQRSGSATRVRHSILLTRQTFAGRTGAEFEVSCELGNSAS